jgi:hypothetical protein
MNSKFLQYVTMAKLPEDEAFQKVDLSRIQGYVLVKFDDKTAVRYSVNMTKDHLSGDAVSAYLLDDVKAEPKMMNMTSFEIKMIDRLLNYQNRHRDQ